MVIGRGEHSVYLLSHHAQKSPIYAFSGSKLYLDSLYNIYQ